MNPYFFIILVVLILGLAGSFYGFAEWAHHGFKSKTIFFWSAGLICLNWYQLPTLMALSGQYVVLSDFNILFAVALPVSFLGFELIYLGSRFMYSAVRMRTIFFILGWFAASLAFYGLFYSSPEFQNYWPLVGSNLLFYAPVFLANLIAAIKIFRKIPALNSPNGTKLKIGAGAYMIASAMGLARSAFSLSFGLLHPPQFAALRFLAPPFIMAQAIGLIFFLITFALLHKADQFPENAGQIPGAGV